MKRKVNPKDLRYLPNCPKSQHGQRYDLMNAKGPYDEQTGSRGRKSKEASVGAIA